jgi:hypothetical protein
MDGMSAPEVSVVLTLDYDVGTEVAWQQLRDAVAALAVQDFDEPFEVVYVEDKRYANQIPEDLTEILPSLRIILSDHRAAYGLIRDGVEAARGSLVGTMDGDCIAAPDWVRRFVTDLRADPEAAAVSGCTTYGNGPLFARCCALLHRSPLRQAAEAKLSYVTNNNAAYRREVYLKHPIPVDAGPFSTGLQGFDLIDGGYRLLYDDDMAVVHAHSGWAFEKDAHLHSGYNAIRSRKLNANQPYAWLLRFGYLAVPVLVLGRTLKSWRICVQNARSYGVAWYELPVAMIVGMAVKVLEAPGMVRAIRGNPMPETRFR